MIVSLTLHYGYGCWNEGHMAIIKLCDFSAKVLWYRNGLDWWRKLRRKQITESILPVSDNEDIVWRHHLLNYLYITQFAAQCFIVVANSDVVNTGENQRDIVTVEVMVLTWFVKLCSLLCLFRSSGEKTFHFLVVLGWWTKAVPTDLQVADKERLWCCFWSWRQLDVHRLNQLDWTPCQAGKDFLLPSFVVFFTVFYVGWQTLVWEKCCLLW